MAMEWSSEYETGEQRVDEQHQNLFSFVNRLEAMVQGGRAGRPIREAEVENLLIFLETYVNVHFAYEELCMTIRRCPVAQKNREAHNKFLEFFGEFSQTVQQGVSLDDLEELHRVLRLWLASHICNIDVKLKSA